ncbi:MAG: deoxyribonuclease IV [Planctomycetes bacterium]|nr:deoxyribonuclease IV [Planctomycetota bacterium]
MLFGAHVSTAGGMPNAVREGLELACEAIQVFTRNQRQWEPKPLDPADIATFRAEGKKAGYLKHAVSHASYLINLCAIDPAILEKSRKAFVDEIRRCGQLGIPYLCIHPGSHLKEGEEAGIAAIVESTRLALEETAADSAKVMVLFENTAGQGTNLGWRLEHLKNLRKGVGGRRIGFCIDTCHLFASGYDLRTPKAYAETMDEVVKQLGLKNIRAFHLNDSKFPLASRRDRHENIGEGEIGEAGFRALVRDERFADLPGLLETPDGPGGYETNLKRLRSYRKK